MLPITGCFCLSSSHFNTSLVRLLLSQNVIITYYYSEKPTIDIVPEYEQRATLDVDVASGKANLKLSSLTLAENTVFKCRVQIPGDDKGKISDTARLVVLGNISLSYHGCVDSSCSFLCHHIPTILVVVGRREVLVFKCQICWFSCSCTFRPRLCHPGKGGVWPEHQPDMQV